MRKILFIISLLAFQNVFADNTFLQRQDVQAFMHMMVKKHHFNAANLNAWFSTVKLRHEVIKKINKPLEKEPWNTYQMLFVNESHIKHGVEFWDKYEPVLRKAEKMYGVPASIIVATIGVETKYGQRTGEFRVIDALSNIAFSTSPRANYFKKELEEFLLLSRDDHLSPLKVLGSYAGAIGQPQFMPSSYRAYAVNFSGTGKTDLMHNEIDVIGSIANYYKKHGWQTNQPVATPAAIIGDRYNYLIRRDNVNPAFTIAEWTNYGVVAKYKIKNEKARVKVIELQNRYAKEYWLGYNNFDVIKRYNASDLYAMAVYQLSAYIYLSRERLNNG